MIQNLGEKAKAELVKLYQHIYTRGTRGKIADTLYGKGRKVGLDISYEATLLRTAIEGRMIGKHVAERNYEQLKAMARNMQEWQSWNPGPV